MTTTNPLTNLSTQLADAVDRIGPALVLVNGRPRHPASGVVFAPGLVLTADHVLEREEEITVQTDDGRQLAAQFAGRDPATDLAVLRVADLEREPAQLAGDARVGQLVLAVARPSPAGPMASLGIVSAVGGPLRSRRGAVLERVIQTDATPYPGFSGGPLIDAAGNVLGLTTTGLLHGVALAVPGAIAWRIAETLGKQGHVKRGYLGVSSQPVPIPTAQRGGVAQETGLLIVRVEEGSAAEQSGLLLGDILVGFNNQPVLDTHDLQAVLAREAAGATVPVMVLRGGQAQTINVTIGERGGK